MVYSVQSRKTEENFCGVCQVIGRITKEKIRVKTRLAIAVGETRSTLVKCAISKIRLVVSEPYGVIYKEDYIIERFLLK